MISAIFTFMRICKYIFSSKTYSIEFGLFSDRLIISINNVIQLFRLELKDIQHLILTKYNYCISKFSIVNTVQQVIISRLLNSKVISTFILLELIISWTYYIQFNNVDENYSYVLIIKFKQNFYSL